MWVHRASCPQGEEGASAVVETARWGDRRQRHRLRGLVGERRKPVARGRAELRLRQMSGKKRVLAWVLTNKGQDGRCQRCNVGSALHARSNIGGEVVQNASDQCRALVKLESEGICAVSLPIAFLHCSLSSRIAEQANCTRNGRNLAREQGKETKWRLGTRRGERHCPAGSRPSTFDIQNNSSFLQSFGCAGTYIQLGRASHCTRTVRQPASAGRMVSLFRPFFNP